MPTPQLSIVIPVLNEAAALPVLLQELRQQIGVELQIIVADGGSTDASRQIADQQADVLVNSEAGRGHQLNAGARVAAADLLLFLHADSGLTRNDQLQRAVQLIQGQTNTAGHFPLRFTDAPAHKRRFYQHLERKTACGKPGSINGDQGLLISQAYFKALGGYDESLPILEDQSISDAIFASGHWRLLSDPLETSSRRFEKQGHKELYFLMMLIMAARRAGLQAFFHRAVDLYKEQSQINSGTQILPFYRLLLQLAEEHPQFWPCMADYAWENRWQLIQLLDGQLATDRQLLKLYNRYLEKSTAKIQPPGMAGLMRWLFTGPVQQWLEKTQPISAPRSA